MTNIYRDKETETILKLLRRGKNVLMLAPRRAGKTFMLNKKFLEDQSTGFQTVMFEVSGMSDEKDFFNSLCAAIQEEQSLGGLIFSALTSRYDDLKMGKFDGDWRKILKVTDYQEFADHLLHVINENKSAKPWLLIVDELPLFVLSLIRVKGAQAAHEFLYWLRKMQQKHQQVLWIYTGSVGLDSVARQHGLEGALVDLEIYSLPPYSAEAARKLLQAIADKRDCKISDEAIDKIIARLGWLSPCYLDLIGEDACSIISESGKKPHVIDAEIAERTINNMLKQNKRIYWSTWREHLDKNFVEPQRGYLYRVLEVIGKAEGSVSKDMLMSALAGEAGMNDREFAETLRGVLDILLNDGYLTETTDRRYQFMFPLLRDWWREYVII